METLHLEANRLSAEFEKLGFSVSLEKVLTKISLSDIVSTDYYFCWLEAHDKVPGDCDYSPVLAYCVQECVSGSYPSKNYIYL